MPTAFADRRHAGQCLAGLLGAYDHLCNALVLALPRGGVPVGFEVASALGLALDVYVVRKLGTPGHPELALGAVAAGGARVLNPDVVAAAGLSVAEVDALTEAEMRRVEAAQHAYRGDLPSPELAGRTLIMVDDGLATGATMRAALAAVRQSGPARVVVAVPVASRMAARALRDQADELVSLAVPEPLLAVGAWYVDFTQTTDEEVRNFLASASAERRPGRKAVMPSLPHATVPSEEVPEADAAEQALEVTPDLGAGPLVVGDEVPEADGLDQATAVPADEEDDWR